MSEFKVGDVVVLASGGPKMTVQDIIGNMKEKPAYKQLISAGYTDKHLVCRFWDETSKKFKIEYFVPEIVQLAE
jgi:uncharacterized protein YodC (DUF2158 family)